MTTKTMYTMTAATFEEGWKKLKETLFEVGELFKDVENTPDAVNKAMIDLIAKHIPSIEVRRNTGWSIIVQTTKSCLKMNNDLSIGWVVGKTVKTKETTQVKDYDFSVIVYNIDRNKYQIKALEDAGFVVSEI
jgi:hypothetical protein